MSFAAGWCTSDEVVMLRCVSVSVPVVVKECEYKSILDETDVSEGWNTFLAERCTSLAV